MDYAPFSYTHRVLKGQVGPTCPYFWQLKHCRTRASRSNRVAVSESQSHSTDRSIAVLALTGEVNSTSSELIFLLGSGIRSHLTSPSQQYYGMEQQWVIEFRWNWANPLTLHSEYRHPRNCQCGAIQHVMR